MADGYGEKRVAWEEKRKRGGKKKKKKKKEKSSSGKEKTRHKHGPYNMKIFTKMPL